MKKTLFLFVLAALLSACANAPVVPPQARAAVAQGLLNDSLFGTPSDTINADDAMALSPEMRHYLESDIAEQLRDEGRMIGLLRALGSRTQIRLEYDSSRTRNAAEAFAARSGNCLSLALMTAALAKELGLTVRYQQVYVDDSWSRGKGLYVSSGHVNLVIGRRLHDITKNVYHDNNISTTVDFFPDKVIADLRTREISEQTIIAMYMNNRAVEAMNEGRITDAYWWVRASVQQDPLFWSAYNTLGVVYERHGNLSQAARAFASALAAEPKNTVAMANQVQALQKLGRFAEAEALQAELQRLQPVAPFYYFKQGVAAMTRGEYTSAKGWFDKELQRSPNSPEVHFWLAQAHFKLKEYQDAREELNLALENSTTQHDLDLYAAKLEKIKSYNR